MLGALFASALLAANVPAPEEAPAPTPAAATEDVEIEVAEEEGLPFFGMSVDAGIPSGLGASAVLRPLPWLRIHGGGATNGAGFGLRGGVGFAPFQWFVTPVLHLQGGYFFEGDARGIASKFIVLPDYGDEALKRLNYTYFNAHLGLEIGSQSGFAFFVRGGPSWISSTVHGLETSLNRNADGIRFTAEDPEISGVIPSAELGFTLYFL